MFDLSQASEGRDESTPLVIYQKPGIADNVVISDVVLEYTTKNNVQYMRLITKGANGEVGKGPQMYLSTDIKNNTDGTPKKTSGWGVTARVLTDLIKATHNVTEEVATPMIKGIETPQALIEKVSALLVGKPFRAKFKGATSAKGYIFAELSQSESMRVEPTKMKFNESYDIKPYEGPMTTSTENKEVPIVDNLPF